MRYLCSNVAKLMEVCRKTHTRLKDDIIEIVETYDAAEDPTLFAIDIHELVEVINDVVITEKQYESITYYGRKSIPKDLFEEVVVA